MRSVSATQIKQFRSCALQWYLQRVEGWEYPQTGSQALGEKTHGQIERYMLEGVTEDLFPSVENAIKKKLIPTYGEMDGRIVEEPKNYGMGLKLADVPVKGRIDLLLPPPPGSTFVRVVDWKTASSFSYTPSPDVLTRDVQGVLYLRYAFEQYPYATEGQFRHVYLLTKGVGSKKVDGEVVTPEFIDGQWRHLEQTVEEMRSTEGRPLAVVAANQAGLSNCDAYGGCKFRDRCPAASKGLVASMFEFEAGPEKPVEGSVMSSLADKLKARKAVTHTVAASAETQAATVGTSIPAETLTVPVVETVPVLAEPSAPAPEAPPVIETVAVLPPDAPKVETVSEVNDKPLAGKTAKTRAKPFASAPKAAETAPTVVAVAEPSAPVPEPVLTTETVVVETPAVSTPTEPSAPFALFIDCYPEKAAFTSVHALEDEIAARTPSLLEHLRKTSPKDVPEGAVDLGEVLFGRGYSTLSASFALRPLSGTWLASTMYPASSKVLEVLIPKATFVVRGRR